jgi:alpha-galactosidase
MRRLLLGAALICGAGPALGAISGVVVPISSVGTLPWEGWSVFYTYLNGASNTQANVQTVSDWLAANLPNYNTIHVDAWVSSRDGSGNPIPDGTKYTDMKVLADHIKANGQVPLIYGDAGTTHCITSPPMAGHYLGDVTTFFATWGYQGIFVDSCGTQSDNADFKEEFTAIRDAMDTLHLPLILMVGNGSLNPNPLFESLPYTYTSARVSQDAGSSGIVCTTDYTGIMRPFWAASYHPGASGPGHFHFLEYLFMGSASLTSDEETTQFLLYALFSSPLVLGCDPRDLNAGEKTLLNNTEVKAINQDPWVLGATRYAASSGTGTFGSAGSYEVYAKWLSVSGTRAIALINQQNTGSQNISFDPALLGITGTYQLRDVVAGSDLGSFSGVFTINGIASHATKLLKLTGGTEAYTTCWAVNPGGIAATSSGAPGGCAFIADNINGQQPGGFPADGTSVSTVSAISTAGLTNPPPQGVWQTARKGVKGGTNSGWNTECPLGYDFNNLDPAGTYKVRLGFAEIEKSGAGQRRFDVWILTGAVPANRVLQNYDIAADAGAVNKGTIKEYTVSPLHGHIAIQGAAGDTDCPLINGIEVIKQ